MGRSVAIRYTVEMVIQDGAGKLYRCTPAEWRTRQRYAQLPGYGMPTEDNLAKYVRGFEETTQQKGANAHLGPQKVLHATIVDQRDRAVIARYAPNVTVPPRD